MSIFNKTLVFKGEIISRETNLPIENAKVTLVKLGKLFSTYTLGNGEFSLVIPMEFLNNDNVIRITFDDIVKKEDSTHYFEDINLVLNQNEMKSHYVCKVDEEKIMLSEEGKEELEKSDPIVIVNGIEIDYDKFEKMMNNKKASSNKQNHFYFEGKSAAALYGEKAKTGLHFFIDEDV